MSTTPVQVNYVGESAPNTFEPIDQIIQRHLLAFQQPRVLSIRPGYEIVGGKLTRVPAIVVTIRKKLDNVPAGQALPTQVERFTESFGRRYSTTRHANLEGIAFDLID